MEAEIIAVGTELLLGDILNTNAQFLSQELAAMGIGVHRQQVVGDNTARLAELVQEAMQRSDLLVFSGGLGPTADDLTKETVAACFDDTLHFDESEWAKITAFFAERQMPLTENNRKQAMVPTRGGKLPNINGTAPGVWFEKAGKLAILLPGPPHELTALWRAEAAPLLAARTQCVLHSIVLHILGGESVVESQIGPLLQSENPTAAVYAKVGEVQLRITARAQTAAEAEAMCHAYAQKFYAVLGDAIYDEDVTGLEETVVRILREKHLTAATAESCTGGGIAQRITAVPGASEVFGFGFVTYANEAKHKLLGVSSDALAQYGAVSPQVAAQMAAGARQAAGADLAVAVTGIAGPTGGTPEKPVGLVYLGVAGPDGVWVCRRDFGGRGRDIMRQRTAQAALDLLRRLALGLPLPGAERWPL